MSAKKALRKPVGYFRLDLEKLAAMTTGNAFAL
jgi:hypothetical protein